MHVFAMVGGETGSFAMAFIMEFEQTSIACRLSLSADLGLAQRFGAGACNSMRRSGTGKMKSFRDRPY